MKIAFLIPPTITGRQNGIVSQALAWKVELETRGVIVDLVSPWETYQWDSYDAIHGFGTGHYLDMLPLLKKRGARRIILSPIYDSNRPNIVMNVMSRLELREASLRTSWAALRSSVPFIDKMLARSNFEAQKLMSIFGVPASKIAMSPLPVRFKTESVEPDSVREPICTHVSILSASIKNVPRLIEASLKYNFPLRLAGRINDVSFQRWLEDIVRESDNIEYLGVLTDEELRRLYRRSRVFALPSLMEGVGLVGLEAALDGADIVITNRGGPKEYYGKLARTVDPESVDEIGQAVRAFLDGETHQPSLSNHIQANYSIEASVNDLVYAYTADT